MGLSTLYRKFSYCWLYIILLFFLKKAFIDFSFKNVFRRNFILEEVNIWFILLTLVIFFFLRLRKSSRSLLKAVIKGISRRLVFAFFTVNILYYYIFFEISLLPTALLIIVWGVQPERLEAVRYFLVYALVGSFPLLANIVFLQIEVIKYNFFLNFKFNTEYFILFKRKKILIFF